MEASRYPSSAWPHAILVTKERTDSTMDDALELGRSGCASGSVVVAAFQEKGRGRVPGRTWLSPPGESLLATVVVRVSELAFSPHEIPLRAGLAVARAVESQAGIRVQIKWPNDIMAGGRKLCGLLCEAHGPIILIGLGINCTQRSFPAEIEHTACSLLQASGRTIPPRELLPAVLDEIKSCLSSFDWLTPLRERLYHREVSVHVDLIGAGRTVEGILRDVDESGRLLLQTSDGRIQAIAQGEIRIDP